MDPNILAIYAIDKQGRKELITNLYWFEENYIHDFAGESPYDIFTFEIYVNNIRVYPPFYITRESNL